MVSSVIAVCPMYNPRHAIPEAPAQWIRYPQIPGTLGLASAGHLLYARLLRSVRELHEKRRVDIIHAHAALPCGQAASLVARDLGVPYFVTVHGLDVFNSCFRGGAAAAWRRRASVKVYRDASIVVCVSGKVQQILNDGMHGGVRSSIVYNGTDCDLFSPHEPSYELALSGSALSGLASPDPDSLGPESASSPEILIAGNLISSKGHDLVLRGMHRLAGSLPRLRCKIIGEGPDRGRLQMLARTLGIAERVHFAGRQPRSAIAKAMRECALFVLPSRSEGLGCVYLEAMACGKPVIACRGQGIEEIIEHQRNGWLISPDNLDELSRGIEAFLRSPERVLQTGAAARETILESLTLAHQAHNLATLYRQVAVLGAPERAL